MSAARYVGRVGGLAIALGVGTAILTGHGVASATTGSEGESGTTATASDGPGTPDESSGGKLTNGLGLTGRHRATDDTPIADTVKSIVDRLSEAHEQRVATIKKDVDAALAGVVKGTQIKRVAQERSSISARGKSPLADKVAAALTDGPAVEQDVSARTVVADKPALQEPRVLEWLHSPRIAVTRLAPSSPASMSANLWTPPAALTATDKVVTPAPGRVSGVFAAMINDVFSPFIGNLPVGTPVGGSVTDLLLLAGTRRESLPSGAVALQTSSIVVDDGVIGGCVVAGCGATPPSGLTFTVVSDPSKGGKVAVNPTTGAFTFLPFADEGSTDGPTGTESFSVLVAETTPFDTFVTGLPLVGTTIFAPVIVTLQQVPVVSVILTPLIGSATRQDILVDIDGLRGTVNPTPVAYTTMVTSFDGTLISTNFFPAIGADLDAAAAPGYETIFYGPGLGYAGATDPTDPYLATFRTAGYNVLTWDPRGEHDSGGVLQLDNPQFEGHDVTELISWVATQDGVESDNPGDPRMGMVGVSYGGGIQLVAAANDDRIDAIAPGWAWNTLPSSLYPDQAFRTAYSALLLLDLVTNGATINNQIYSGIITGAVLGILTSSQIALLASSGPGFTVGNIEAPTLLIHGTVDVLFPLQQSVVNAGYLTNADAVKVIWYCGGHGTCLPGQGNPAADDAWVLGETQAWMDRFVKEDGTIDTGPVFEWSDQNGTYWYSNALPSASNFYSGNVVHGSGTGSFLPIIPIVGGSGPSQAPFPYSLGDGSVASNAANIALDSPTTTTNVVGAPTVTFEYSGIGTSRHVYAQIVDLNTGLVVGNVVTPIPVVLDGTIRSATVQLNDIAYTMDSSSNLELQIVTTAIPFLNLTQFGYIDIGEVSVDLPIPADAHEQLDSVSQEQLVAV